MKFEPVYGCFVLFNRLFIVLSSSSWLLHTKPRVWLTRVNKQTWFSVGGFFSCSLYFNHKTHSEHKRHLLTHLVDFYASMRLLFDLHLQYIYSINIHSSITWGASSMLHIFHAVKWKRQIESKRSIDIWMRHFVQWIFHSWRFLQKKIIISFETRVNFFFYYGQRCCYYTNFFYISHNFSSQRIAVGISWFRSHHDCNIYVAMWALRRTFFNKSNWRKGKREGNKYKIDSNIIYVRFSQPIGSRFLWIISSYSVYFTHQQPSHPYIICV